MQVICANHTLQPTPCGATEFNSLGEKIRMIMDIPNVDAWLRDILSKDPMTYEDAYWGVRPPVDQAVPEIIRALDVHLDSYTRGKLIELLGESGSPAALPILEKELLNLDESLRNWARGGIDALISCEPWQKNAKY